MRLMNRTRAPFLAVLLMAGALAACSDAPTAVIAPDNVPPALNTAPQPTVTSSGGHPLISWPAVAGAASYRVRLAYIWVTAHPGGEETYNGETYFVGSTTTATSLLDTSQGYTGDPQCGIQVSNGDVELMTYFYEVTANFAGGTASGYVSAPVAPC